MNPTDEREEGGPQPGAAPTVTSRTNPKEDTAYPSRVTLESPPGHLVDPVTVQQLAELLADHDHHDQRAADAYRDGYADGHRSGWEVGYAHAYEEMARHWRGLAAAVHHDAASPTHDELERRRSQSEGAIHQARLDRHGYEYKGGPIDWETGCPVRRTA